MLPNVSIGELRLQWLHLHILSDLGWKKRQQTCKDMGSRGSHLATGILKWQTRRERWREGVDKRATDKLKDEDSKGAEWEKSQDWKMNREKRSKTNKNNQGRWQLTSGERLSERHKKHWAVTWASSNAHIDNSTSAPLICGICLPWLPHFHQLFDWANTITFMHGR